MTLSRNKSSNQGNHSAQGTILNTNFQECGDCSSPSKTILWGYFNLRVLFELWFGFLSNSFADANWASLNHGVLICDECCLAHRSLGRCISIIKSLRKSYWPQSLIDVTFMSLAYLKKLVYWSWNYFVYFITDIVRPCKKQFKSDLGS